MDREEIRYLLGSTIYAGAKAYENRVQDLECETAENGVRHLSADVRGSGRNLYRTQAWLRQNGSFVSASCTCPLNENGEGPCCKHIGALLLHEVDEPEEKTESKPEKKALLDIPGVQRVTEFAKEAAARKDSYVSGLEMLFGRKWRGDEPVSDVRAQELLRAYQEDALSEVERKNKESTLYHIGEFTFDTQKQLLSIRDKQTKLTTKENELLALLCSHTNEILQRDFALKTIWIDDNYFNARSMDVYITKLRKHLKDDPQIEIINIHGKGYKLIAPEQE